MSILTLLSDVSIMNLKLGLRVSVPINHRVLAYTGRNIFKLLNKAHCITLFIFNRNLELVDIVLLRSLYSPVMGSTGQSGHCD